MTLYVFLYLFLGGIVCTLGFASMRVNNDKAPIVSYLIVVVFWPLILVIGFGKAMLNLLMKEI